MAIATLTFLHGATVVGGETEFRVWAPDAGLVTLRLQRAGDKRPQDIPLARDPEGTFSTRVAAAAGDRYEYIVDHHHPVPDPVSRYLPEGLHRATEIVDPAGFEWNDDDWRGLPLEEFVIYELHVGTFTVEGTFDAVIERLAYLRELGVTAIELMPVAQFPGERNWGYDGASLYAVQNSYGGPAGLKRLVDAAHAAGLAVILDVVYNHVGNEGNYLRLFGPYFTACHHTPWGDAINYDQPGSEAVRRYVVENALYWIREYHVDGLRLDAVQTIHDDGPTHILAEITGQVQRLGEELGRTVCVIAETDENDTRVTQPRARGGYGVDAVWSDDFHHALHALLTGERKGYYQDFGRAEQIVRALNEGFVFQGEPFGFWQGRPRGTRAAGMRAPAHVICIQNHDQVGNRARGERLAELVPRGARLMMAALLLLAPQTPLLFMGQEYDEPAPFQFFTSYSDPGLREAVTKGRRSEFKDFHWDDVPDPEDAQTFARAKLNWDISLRGDNAMLKWYRELIALRKRVYGAESGDRSCRAELLEGGAGIEVKIPRDEPRVMLLASLKPGGSFDARAGWRELLCQDEDGYRVAVYERE